MALLSRQELESLAHPRQHPCVSIYMPAHPAGPDIRQDPIRFKNLLKQARERLVETGFSAQEAEQYLQPAAELDRSEFWRHQQNGLVVFVAEGFLRYYRVPLPLRESVIVSNAFHLKPILPLLTDDTRLYILALSQKQVRLLEATRERVNEIDLSNVSEVPQSLVDLLQYEVPERQVEHSSTGSAKQPGQQGQFYHGHGESWRDKKDEIRRFCDRLDSGLNDFFESDRAPLVLAGVDSTVAIFREATSYANIMDESISGNADRAHPTELHERAWSIVAPHLAQAREVAAERYREIAAHHPEQTANDIQAIVRAAHDGRIDTLFAASGYPLWGQLDPSNRGVSLHDDSQADDADLSNLALLHTLLNGGNAFITDYDAVPNGTVAAILRY